LSLRIVLGRSVLVPEISFYRAGRLSRYAEGEEVGEITAPPDIAVEFLAPGQWSAEPRRKLRLAIRCGGKLGWLIDTRRKRIMVLRPGRSLEIFEVDGALNGEDALPGFSLSLETNFDWLEQD
jgi:Uma2 family endonuclease